jgi:hypothetical protein
MGAAGDNSASPAASPPDTIFGGIPISIAKDLPPSMIRTISGGRVTDFDIDSESETVTAVASYPLLDA